MGRVTLKVTQAMKTITPARIRRSLSCSAPWIFINLLLLAAFAGGLVPRAYAGQTDIPGPAGSGAFGSSVSVLPNGNIVVIDPSFDAPGPVADVGAVYLYSPTGVLISTLKGDTSN